VSVRTVLCYGDSNTHGWRPDGGGRWPLDVRWTGVLAEELGPEWRVVEEGLNSRTTVHDDPLTPHRNGREYLVPCLASHAPLDAVTIFLGMNDLKARFAVGASDIAAGVGALAALVLASGAGPGGAPPRVLLLGLPRLGRIEGGWEESFAGAQEKAARLPGLLEATAADLGVGFLDLPTVACSDLDGVHLDEAAHRAIGEAVARSLAAMF